MRINGIPVHVARAYGAERPAAIARTSAAPSTSATPAPKQAARPDSLVAASVSGRVDFQGQVPAASTGSLSLYTRAADRVEAAVGVAIGSTIDVRG